MQASLLRRSVPFVLLRRAAYIAPTVPRALSTTCPLANAHNSKQHPHHNTSPFLAAAYARPMGVMHNYRAPHAIVPHSPVMYHQVRSLSSRHGDNWRAGRPGGHDWLDTVKTGALLALGAGAVVATASVGFGVVIFGAAGYGIYTLYQRFVRPFRPSRYERDWFRDIDDNIERVFRDTQRRTSGRGSSSASSSSREDPSREIDALVDGLPFMLRGLVRTVFEFAGGALRHSMKRAGEMRRLTNEYLRSNPRVVEEMGDNVSIFTPQNWIETSVNGVSRVEAVFPVGRDAQAIAFVTAKATVDSNGQLQFTRLQYHNHRTGEVIDLLRDDPTARKKTVVNADFVDKE